MLVPDLEHRETFCTRALAAVVYVWLGPIPSFSSNSTLIFFGKLPLPFSVLQTCGLDCISKGEEHVAWA